ncbi:hypothetical protein DQ04_03431010 [Trypanosoma grayi]|uniref:hypothetical protein n=1 Tax=Trypanosoma grayi TaxID=71804 RepID=UPI0004F46B15|nr:hypothetical protein DQ04_03431010 [Trypanosoma grayi]KEG10671.1 hypothetical protein DQ04_03431010 [Trypanosoma grayi]
MTYSSYDDDGGAVHSAPQPNKGNGWRKSRSDSRGRQNSLKTRGAAHSVPDASSLETLEQRWLHEQEVLRERQRRVEEELNAITQRYGCLVECDSRGSASDPCSIVCEPPANYGGPAMWLIVREQEELRRSREDLLLHWQQQVRTANFCCEQVVAAQGGVPSAVVKETHPCEGGAAPLLGGVERPEVTAANVLRNMHWKTQSALTKLAAEEAALASAPEECRYLLSRIDTDAEGGREAQVTVLSPPRHRNSLHSFKSHTTTHVAQTTQETQTAADKWVPLRLGLQQKYPAVALTEPPAGYGTAVGPMSRGLAKKATAAETTTTTVLQTLVSSHHGAVERYHDFVSKHGGATLGWSEQDHQRFLRLVLQLQRVQVKPNAVGCATSHAFPHAELLHVAITCFADEKTLPEIEEHVRLFLRYQELLYERRVAVEAYQQQRQADEAEAAELALWHHRQKEQRNAAEQQKQEHSRQKRQVAIKAKVAEWRATKEEEVAALGQKQRREAELSHLWEVEQRRSQRLEVKTRELQNSLNDAPYENGDAAAPVVPITVINRASNAPLVSRDEAILQQQQLQRRWLESKQRALHRASQIAAKQAETARQSKAAILERQHQSLCASRGVETSSATQPPKTQRYLDPTESSSARVSSDVGGCDKVNEKRSGWLHHATELIPTPSVLWRSHRGAPSWCGRSYTV